MGRKGFLADTLDNNLLQGRRWGILKSSGNARARFPRGSPPAPRCWKAAWEGARAPGLGTRSLRRRHANERSDPAAAIDSSFSSALPPPSEKSPPLEL